ncbi:MAG: LacI family DNA-binding transcriptional regulator [Silicimonas sp.]|nr:LacI family DNA-binding transcriptional regulator [Silicimonas sp.]
MPTDQKSIAHSARQRKPTLRTIADRTGFAVTTVSRALKGDPLISEKTRETVSSAAAEVGYVPDRAAQRLRTGRTKVISLLVNPAHEFLGFTAELLTGLTSALDGTGYSVTIIPDFIRQDRVEAVRNILRNNLADGLIFTRTEAFDERVRVLLEADFPFVTHGRTEFSLPHPYVDFDNEAYARLAVRRLVEKGRRRLGIILPEARFTFTQHLRYGFMAAAREAGVDFEFLDKVNLDSSPDRISAQVLQRLKAHDAPDGLVCVGEVTALATLAALDDCGMELGRELDLVAKRASPVFGLLRPRVEAVFEDIEATGRDMATLLLRRLSGESSETLQILHQPEPRFG